MALSESADVVLLRNGFQSFRSKSRSVIPQNPSIMSLRGGRTHAPDAAIFNETIRHPGTKCRKTERPVAAAKRFPCTLAHTALRFIPYSRASPRNALPKTLRLPRRFAPRNDTKSWRFCGLNTTKSAFRHVKSGRFCKPTAFNYSVQYPYFLRLAIRNTAVAATESASAMTIDSQTPSISQISGSSRTAAT